MKLMRYGAKGAEKPALVDANGVVRDLSGELADITAHTLTPQSLQRLRDLNPATLPAVENPGRIALPWTGCGKFIAIGLNYADHAAESNLPVPKEPVVFMKTVSCMVGCNDAVVLPQGSVKGDWEVELGIVIGQRASYLADTDAARAVIAGYVLVNDVSERAFQNERGGQWSKGKSAETFNPAGPWLATPDEIPDVHNLGMTLDVNGVRRQTGSTSTMVFDPYVIVHYLSQFLVLEPGDLIDTGTPPGVAMGMASPAWLQEGDVMELAIDGLGRQRQTVIGPRT
jgi:2,4-diketo-3-deoxy-L-fuconate hydrolase